MNPTLAPSQPQMPPCNFAPPAYTGPSRDEIMTMRREFTNPAIFHMYQEPLLIVDGHMQYLFDETGRRYLDLFAGIVTVSCGHCHPKVLSAIQGQQERLQHTTTIYAHPNFPVFAKKLASKMPPGLSVTYFTNSGSEANDLAILMARLHTGNFDVLALENGYHGGSPGAMGLTALHTWKYPVPQGAGVHHVPSPDPYRSQFEGTAEAIAQRSVEAARRTIQFSTPGRVAAFISEAFQGVGGVTSGSPIYWQEIYRIIRAHGGVCIADEVQTGFGRTGEHYWGFQNYGVVPDIVTMAKGIGNGVPLGAVTTTRTIAERLAQRLHFNTFGANPVAMAAGSAVLDVIEEEGLQQNCRVMGGYLRAGLERLEAEHALIGDVRGKGLMIGVELVTDRNRKTPAKEATADLVEAAREMGVLIGKGGLFGNVLRIKPPMCITRGDVDFALEVLHLGLSHVTK